MLIYANEKNLMTYIFPERGKIDKAQFISDRSALVLKTCKIPSASLNCKMLRFISLSFSEAAHAYSFHTKNFAILTKFSDSLTEKTFNVRNFTAIQLMIIPQWQNTYFCILMRGPMPCWTWDVYYIFDNIYVFGHFDKIFKSTKGHFCWCWIIIKILSVLHR